VCGSALALGGSPEQQAALLPGICSGEQIVIPAWLEPNGGYGPRGIQLRAQPDPEGWRLSGVKRHVVFASSATTLVVPARAGDEIVLCVVDPSAPGITMEQQKTMASDCQYRVEFDNVLARSAIAGGWDTWDAAMHEALILAAAQAVGGARYALDITVQYAKDRHQFDKPLGAFQALAHYLADASTAVDGAQTLVWEAAWARSNGRSIDRLAPMAKLFACRTFRDVTAMAQQIFGGVGFTVDYDIQLYFRRAKQLELSWWDTRYLEELVAADVLDRVGA
jgi:alkylation response protein AidB-like acyl-CoA dehydrogenase